MSNGDHYPASARAATPTFEERLVTLETWVAHVETVSASVIERIEALEPAARTPDSNEVGLRRAALARLGPFKASAHDTDSITTADGRRLLALYTAAERDLVLQALNDAWLAHQR